MTEKNFDVLSSQTNPNGLLDTFISGQIHEVLPDRQLILTAAMADIKSYGVEVAGLDPDMAEVLAARAVQEVVLALKADIPEYEVQKAIIDGAALSEEAAVERAIDQMLNS